MVRAKKNGKRDYATSANSTEWCQQQPRSAVVGFEMIIKTVSASAGLVVKPAASKRRTRRPIRRSLAATAGCDADTDFTLDFLAIT